MTKALVLLSGGQDSTTCLYWAKAHFDEVAALSIYYGQRHKTELEAAREIAGLAKVAHYEIDIPALQLLGDSALVDDRKELAGSGGLVDKEMPQGLPTSFVPGRNLLFLATAAACAVKLGAKHIVTGVCQTDYSGYPDCRQEFISAMEVAVTRAMPTSVGPLYIDTPLMFLTKAETVVLANDLEGCWDALARSITCYHGKRPGCGTCPACELRMRGFADAGMLDPQMAA